MLRGAALERLGALGHVHHELVVLGADALRATSARVVADSS